MYIFKQIFCHYKQRIKPRRRSGSKRVIIFFSLYQGSNGYDMFSLTLFFFKGKIVLMKNVILEALQLKDNIYAQTGINHNDLFFKQNVLGNLAPLQTCFTRLWG